MRAHERNEWRLESGYVCALYTICTSEKLGYDATPATVAGDEKLDEAEQCAYE